MDGAFDSGFRNNPNFPALLSLLESELPGALLPQMVNNFEGTVGGFIYLGGANGGSFNNNWNDISIDARFLPVAANGSGTATTQDIQTVQALLSYELAPLLYFHPDYLTATDPNAAAAAGARSEGVALTVEFIATQQLGLPMYQGTGIQSIMQGVLTAAGGVLSTDQSSKLWADEETA